jgi:hypothetical protein
MLREFLGMRAPPCDCFTWRPWIWVLFLWFVAALPPILFRSTLPSILWTLFVSIPAICVVAPGVGLILVVVNLFRRRWRAATSIVLASAAFAFALLGSLRFSDELRWYVFRSYYVAEIEKSPARRVWWDGGLGWDVTLEYLETKAEEDGRARQVGECKRTLKEIAPHYFLNGMYC